MKGKCFSAVNRGQRKKSDFYQTPYSMTEQLLEYENFDYNKGVLECACGNGAIQKILNRNFKYVIAYDIQKGFYLQKDFLKTNSQESFIITNPPFSLAFEFIQKAKKIATEKFAMLLPLSYLHGQKRYEQKIFLDKNYPLTKIYVFTRYPLLEDTIMEDGKYRTGMIAYAWYIWENMDKYNYMTKRIINNIYPQIKWIDNNKYILRK